MENETMDLYDGEDFELKEPTYQVWAFSYDEDDNYIGNTQLLYTSEDPDEALNYADTLTVMDISFSLDTAYVKVELETVIEDEDGNAENIDGHELSVFMNPSYELKKVI